MGTEVNFKAGNGITLIPDTANGVITIKGEAPPPTPGLNLTQNQKDALVNPIANENNKFITVNEIREFIVGGSAPLQGFPLLLTADENFQVSQNGRYRITAVGGGGAGYGDLGGTTPNQVLVPSTPTIIKLGDKTFTARGGHSASNVTADTPEFPYDGIRGAVKGGDNRQNGENAKGNGGSGGEGGGGGGSPFPKGEELFLTTGGYVTDTEGILYPAGSGGNGYGAGGGGYNGAGGSSGYLLVKEIVLLKGEVLNITIGKGATAAFYSSGVEAIGGGNGAPGAVLLEQV